MRFDLRESPDAPAPDLYRAALDMAAWAERHGCAAVALSEHHSAEGHLPSPLVMAAALAGRTESLPIMVAAAILPLYDPVRLAEDLVVLDLASGGRVSVVLGLGYRREEYDLYGIPFGERASLVEARLAVLLEALRDGIVAGGERSGGVRPRPLTPGGPSLAYGGSSRAAARRAARFGLDLLAQTDSTDLRDAYLAECEARGQAPGQVTLPSPELPLALFVADDVDRAWDELGPHLLRDVTTYSRWNGGDTSTASLSNATTVEELRAERRSHRIVTAEEARELLRELGYLTLHPLCGGIPPHVAWPYLRRAAHVVDAG